MTKRKASVALETGNESNQSTSTQDNNSNSTSTTTGTNNNQANKNGTSSGTNNNCRQQIGGNNGSQHKSKKERADNWSSAEIQVLHRGIDSRRDIFYGPPSQATKKNRELAWDAITKEVNSVSTTPRTMGQVMKKFKNEKCRAKRKFVVSDKDSQSDMSNGINTNNNTDNTAANNNAGPGGLTAQNHPTSNNQQQQLQPQQQQLQQQQQQQQLSQHHMTNSDSVSSQTSINVVKLAPQNVAKTMIDLPGHVQQLQMPNDDMVLIVPPDMDGLLSGMNIVSDALSNHQQSHHGQHTIQAINAGPSLMNGTMGGGMMARTIPAGSMCSLVYSAGGEVCGTEQHVTSGVTGASQLSANHLGVNAQSLMHHRATLEQSQGQPQQQPQQQQQQQQHPHHQSHPHQQQHPQQTQQPQQQHQTQHPSHQPQIHQHHQHHLQQQQQNHLTSTTTISANSGGVAVESQLKNLLFNLLLKDGQHPIPNVGLNQEYNKQRNEMLAIIASSLNKIEGHLSRISKVAGSLFAQNINGASNDDLGTVGGLGPVSSDNNNNLNMRATDNNNNGGPTNASNNPVAIAGSGSAISSQRGSEA